MVTTNAGPAQLFRNDTTKNHSLRIKLQGTKSNQDGIGAIVRVQAAGNSQWLMMRSGSSYLSQSELVLTFGLGVSSKADHVDIEWPSGHRDILSNVAADQIVTVAEAGGVKASHKLKPRP